MTERKPFCVPDATEEEIRHLVELCEKAGIEPFDDERVMPDFLRDLSAYPDWHFGVWFFGQRWIWGSTDDGQGHEALTYPQAVAHLKALAGQDEAPADEKPKVDFSRFTDRARKVMGLAKQEASRMGHDHIAPEHLLAAIAREGSGIGWAALDRRGIGVQDIRRAVESRPGTTSDYAELVFRDSMRHASRRGDHHVGTEHILLALTWFMPDAWSTMAVDPAAVRKAVYDLLGDIKDEAEAMASKVVHEKPKGDIDEVSNRDSLIRNARDSAAEAGQCKQERDAAFALLEAAMRADVTAPAELDDDPDRTFLPWWLYDRIKDLLADPSRAGDILKAMRKECDPNAM